MYGHHPYAPPPPPKQDRTTLYIVLAIVGGVLVLGGGACRRETDREIGYVAHDGVAYGDEPGRPRRRLPRLALASGSYPA